MSKNKNSAIEENSVVLARRAYQKAWREKNKDKVKAANERFWAKKAAEFEKE